MAEAPHRHRLRTSKWLQPHLMVSTEGQKQPRHRQTEATGTLIATSAVAVVADVVVVVMGRIK